MAILGGCLCFDLPTGCKIIGVLYLVVAILNFIALGFVNLGLWVFHFIIDAVKEALKTQSEFAGMTLKVKEDSSIFAGDEMIGASDDGKTITINTDDEMIDKYIFIIKIVFLVFLILSFLSIVTSSMLIRAVKTARRGLLMPWVIQEVIHILVGVACIVGLLVSIQAVWVWCVPFLVSLVFQVFFMVVVISQYQALGLLRMHDDEMRMK